MLDVSWNRRLCQYLRNLTEQQGCTERTAYEYLSCLSVHTFEGWKDRLADTITAQEIRDLIIQKTGHRSPARQKAILKCIRGAFQFALEAEYVHRNPAPNMKFRMGDKIKSKRCMSPTPEPDGRASPPIFADFAVAPSA